MESNFEPIITSTCWAVFNAKNGTMVSSKNPQMQVQIASITKIMTAYLCFKYITKLNINSRQVLITAPESAEFIEGTIAGISEGDKLTLEDLLYALLLPSGNDAAICLASYFGNIIKQLSPIKSFISPEKAFINEMNATAKQLHMSNTIFSNPHGMHNLFNKSTCLDIGILSIAAMKVEGFRRIVATVQYQCNGRSILGDTVKFNWKNTNKLLLSGFNGIKTGTTSSAGPCLVASYEKDDIWVISVVLNSSTEIDRWQDSIKLTKWYIKQAMML